MKSLITFCLLLVIVPVDAFAADLRVVTTLSTFADLVRQVGGDRVQVSSVAPPQFNPHFIEPKPTDVLKLKRADLFVHAGLDLELWRQPLVTASGRSDFGPGGEHQLDLSQGVRLLEVPSGVVSRAEGDVHLYGNPHYWLSPENALVMLSQIAAKLAALDPDHAAEFKARSDELLVGLQKSSAQWRAMMQPYRGAALIGYHNEWVYLVDFAGLQMDLFLEPKPGIPPTPKHIAELVEAAREKKVRAIVQASFFPTRAAESLAERTGVPFIEICQNVAERDECGDYQRMMQFNFTQLLGALRHG